ncbi:MAG: hypothetical protein II928_03020 [Paludibacteraceae bacterium]|nr:hypothetical protein [Paludibacteraceae bacterium]
MKRVLIIMSALVLSAGVLMAQDKEGKKNHVPEVGAVSIGFTFNAASLGTQLAAQPKADTHVGAFIQDLAGTPKSMYVLSQDPVAAFRVKYRLTEHWNIRGSLGFNGSHVNYSEYVKDDLAALIDPNTENKVVDHIKSDLNSTNFAFGAEFTAGKGNLKFVAGLNLLYAFAGGKVGFAYGNQLTKENQVPTSMGMTATGGAYDDWTAAQGIAWARPVERKNVGFSHGLGIQADMGIEWFFIDHLSLGAAVTFTPVMFVKQCQTYTVYEGYSATLGDVMQYNKLVSPGSWACLYGTDNLGFQLSLNYYF